MEGRAEQCTQLDNAVKASQEHGMVVLDSFMSSTKTAMRLTNLLQCMLYEEGRAKYNHCHSVTPPTQPVLKISDEGLIGHRDLRMRPRHLVPSSLHLWYRQAPEVGCQACLKQG